MNVSEVLVGDDVGIIIDYKLYEVGGLFYFINVFVNEMVDFDLLLI